MEQGLDNGLEARDLAEGTGSLEEVGDGRDEGLDELSEAVSAQGAGGTGGLEAGDEVTEVDLDAGDLVNDGRLALGLVNGAALDLVDLDVCRSLLANWVLLQGFKGSTY